MLYYGKNARKKTRRTVKQDKQGKVVGYPLFVRPDREILKKKHRKVYHSGSLFLMNWTQQKALKSSNNGQGTKRLYLCL